MGITTFSGPIRAGNIPNTTGTTLGEDVRNVGSVMMAQHYPITQAGTHTTALGTNIVLPANSHIVNIQVLATTAWSTASNAVSIGTTVASSNELTDATNVSAIGLTAFAPGANATRTTNWDDTGTTDKRIFVLSSANGAGVGTLTIRYIQAHDLAST